MLSPPVLLEQDIDWVNKKNHVDVCGRRAVLRVADRNTRAPFPIGGRSMKTTLRTLQRIAFLAIISVTLMSLAPVFATAAEKKPALKKKELMALLANAKTPADHRVISDYYRYEVLRLSATSKEHFERAVSYKKTSTTAGGRQVVLYQGMSRHCERLAQLQAEQSKEAEALATLHEDMAKAAEQEHP